jgi:hypothetical protein
MQSADDFLNAGHSADAFLDASAPAPVQASTTPVQAPVANLFSMDPKVDIADFLTHMASGAVATPVAGLAGLGTIAGRALGLTSADPADVVSSVQGALTYQPRTQGGQELSSQVSYPFAKLAQGADYVGGKVADLTASPALGAIANAGIQALPLVFGRGLAGDALKAEAAPIAADVLSPMDSQQSLSAAAATPDIGATSPELQAAVVNAAKRTGGAVNPDALSRHLEAESLPIEMQLTAGQATQDPVAISQEMNMRGNQPAIADRLNAQNGQLVQNLQALRDQVGPDVFSTNPGQHADTLIEAYKAKNAAAQADISAKYQALEDANGGQFPVDAQALLDNASDALHQQLLFDHAPKEIMSTLNRLADNDSMTFENYESLRTNLARIQRSATADGNTQAAAGVIRNTMEQLPLAPEAASLKPLADQARAAARTQFDALEADPAYKAAVNDTVPPDRFINRFIVNAPRDDVALMSRNLTDNDTARQTMGVAALDQLRTAAKIDPDWNGNFSSASYNKALQTLSPKLGSLVDPGTADQLSALGNVAGYTQFQPRGAFVNNSNTFVSGAANYGIHALEGAANVAAHGIPVGTWVRGGAQRMMQGRQTDRSGASRRSL